jgi:hypothetical protein
LVILSALILSACNVINPASGNKDKCIKPWTENPHYWQYKGKPVLLLGATDNDNLFQNENIESHLDSLRAIGGNYIRNTMSDRDQGDEKAFLRTPDGKYDLTQWNDVYWKKFTTMLQLASERDIIVQIEIWDRFDHSRNEWLTDPYNPGNNINYTYAETGLDSIYPSHPGRNEQPFFYSVPELNNNEVILKYQQAFVRKLISISLEFDNVLYCIDNETSGVEEWATYWTGFIRENSKGKEINITQMWDTWDVKSDIHKRTLDHPERYGYIDISQNSQLPGYQNWVNQQYVFDYIKDHPRPVNSTKIYGSDNGTWLDRGITTEHAVQTFFRNILGGYASSRFHRPPHGLGLSQTSINCLKSVRMIEEQVKFWDLDPAMDLILNNEENLAYIAAKDKNIFVIYFTKPGRVGLDLSDIKKDFKIRWINIVNAEWGEAERIKGGGVAELESYDDRGSIAVITRN